MSAVSRVAAWGSWSDYSAGAAVVVVEGIAISVFPDTLPFERGAWRWLLAFHIAAAVGITLLRQRGPVRAGAAVGVCWLALPWVLGVANTESDVTLLVYPFVGVPAAAVLTLLFVVAAGLTRVAQLVLGNSGQLHRT